MSGDDTGLVMPAEWEQHEATWLAFPHNPGDWPGKLSTVQWAHCEIARQVSAGERVNLLVNDESAEREARQRLLRSGVAEGSVTFLRFPTDRAWMRDAGPIFVRRKEQAPPNKESCS